jgi:Patatin-like phospholipase
LSNNPAAYYNDRERIDCNLNLPLWQLVRASTAAPTFFPPEVIVLAEGTDKEYRFVFVDGGVTTYNNPAFLDFHMAIAAPYAVNWKTGVDEMLIVSVGTGNAPRTRPGLQADDLWLLDHAKKHSLSFDERRVGRLGYVVRDPWRVPLWRAEREGIQGCRDGTGRHQQLDRTQAIHLCSLRSRCYRRGSFLHSKTSQTYLKFPD